MKTFDKWIATLAVTAASALALSQGGFPGQGGPPPGPGQGGRPGQGGFPGGPPQGGPGQGGPGMRGGMMMGGGPQILRRPEVQKELKLTETQIEKLDQILGGPGGQRGPGGFQGGPPPGGPPNGGPPNGGPPQGVPPQGPPGPGGFQGGPPQGGPPPGGPPQGGPGGFQRGPGGPGGQRGPGGAELVAQLEKRIKEVLSETQFKRYHELVLQEQGPQALMRPEIADKVGLSDEKRGKIAEIVRSSFPGMGRGPGGPGGVQGGPPQGPPGQGGFQGGPPQGGPPQGPPGQGGFPGGPAAMEKNRKETAAKILAVLSADELAKWKSLLGREFKFEAMGPRGGF